MNDETENNTEKGNKNRSTRWSGDNIGSRWELLMWSRLTLEGLQEYSRIDPIRWNIYEEIASKTVIEWWQSRGRGLEIHEAIISLRNVWTIEHTCSLLQEAVVICKGHKIVYGGSRSLRDFRPHPATEQFLYWDTAIRPGSNPCTIFSSLRELMGVIAADSSRSLGTWNSDSLIQWRLGRGIFLVWLANGGAAAKEPLSLRVRKNAKTPMHKSLLYICSRGWHFSFRVFSNRARATITRLVHRRARRRVALSPSADCWRGGIPSSVIYRSVTRYTTPESGGRSRSSFTRRCRSSPPTVL